MTTFSQNHWRLGLQYLAPVPLVVRIASAVNTEVQFVLANLQQSLESLNLPPVHEEMLCVCRGAGSDDGHNFGVGARRKMNVGKPNDNQ